MAYAGARYGTRRAVRLRRQIRHIAAVGQFAAPRHEQHIQDAHPAGEEVALGRSQVDNAQAHGHRVALEPFQLLVNASFVFQMAYVANVRPFPNKGVAVLRQLEFKESAYGPDLAEQTVWIQRGAVLVRVAVKLPADQRDELGGRDGMLAVAFGAAVRRHVGASLIETLSVLKTQQASLRAVLPS